MALLIGFCTVLSTFMGGLFALRFKDKLHLILGFSAGAVIGVAFFDLLPEAIDLATQSYNLPTITSLVALGFAIFLILDRAISLHFHDDDHSQERGQLSATSLSIHSFLDGLGIGLAFKVSPAVGWVVAAAVLAHDFSDGINTISVILKNKGEKKQAFKWLLIDALAPAIGVVATMFFTVSQPILGLILALFAGFFLYIGASDLVPESHHYHPSFWTTVMTLLGMLVLYIAIHFAL